MNNPGADVWRIERRWRQSSGQAAISATGKRRSAKDREQMVDDRCAARPLAARSTGQSGGVTPPLSQCVSFARVHDDKSAVKQGADNEVAAVFSKPSCFSLSFVRRLGCLLALQVEASPGEKKKSKGRSEHLPVVVI